MGCFSPGFSSGSNSFSSDVLLETARQRQQGLTGEVLSLRVCLALILCLCSWHLFGLCCWGYAYPRVAYLPLS